MSVVESKLVHEDDELFKRFDKRIREMREKPKAPQVFTDFYQEPMPALFHWLRTVYNYNPNEVMRCIQQNPEHLTKEHYYIHPKITTTFNRQVVYFDWDKIETVKFISTPLHEAIISGSPLLVTMVCEHSPKNMMNYNPRKKRNEFSAEYSYTPLDFALLPYFYEGYTRLLRQSDIVNILIKYGARREDGSCPKVISKEEINTLYQYLFKLVQEHYQIAKSQNKAFIIPLFEYHSSRWCLLLGGMILSIASELGIKNYYMEHSLKSLQCKREFGTYLFDHNSSELRPIFHKDEFFTANYTLPLCDSLGIEAIPVDVLAQKLSAESFFARLKRTPEQELWARNEVMVKEITARKESGVFITGAAHVGVLKDKSFDPDKFYLLPINISPAIRNHEQSHFTCASIEQIPALIKGEVTLWSPEEIINVVERLNSNYSVILNKRFNKITEELNHFLGKTGGAGKEQTHSPIISIISDYLNLTPSDPYLVSEEFTASSALPSKECETGSKMEKETQQLKKP